METLEGSIYGAYFLFLEGLSLHQILRFTRAPDKDRFLLSRMAISSPNPMFDHLLESSHQDDSYKWSNIGFGEEITQVELIDVNLLESSNKEILPFSCLEHLHCSDAS